MTAIGYICDPSYEILQAIFISLPLNEIVLAFEILRKLLDEEVLKWALFHRSRGELSLTRTT
ncbi:MAG: hypothetical protein PHY05_10375 [Methanothrix sp.]|nr:hypothetical protein [Methanothrix sp.]